MPAVQPCTPQEITWWSDKCTDEDCGHLLAMHDEALCGLCVALGSAQAGEENAKEALKLAKETRKELDKIPKPDKDPEPELPPITEGSGKAPSAKPKKDTGQ